MGLRLAEGEADEVGGAGEVAGSGAVAGGGKRDGRKRLKRTPRARRMAAPVGVSSSF